MIVLFIILAFIIGVYLGSKVIIEYVYSIHRINKEEYEYFGSFNGFIDTLLDFHHILLKGNSIT